MILHYPTVKLSPKLLSLFYGGLYLHAEVYLSGIVEQI